MLYDLRTVQVVCQQYMYNGILLQVFQQKVFNRFDDRKSDDRKGDERKGDDRKVPEPIVIQREDLENVISLITSVDTDRK